MRLSGRCPMGEFLDDRPCPSCGAEFAERCHAAADRDAKRFDAIMHCGRIRIVGSAPTAGFEYHLCVELWVTHPLERTEADHDAARRLAAFADRVVELHEKGIIRC